MNRADLRELLANAKQIATSPRVASEFATRLIFRAQVHQDNTLSWPDRYPRLFGQVGELLAEVPAPHLLSYGCSAGEEVLSLERLFPDATVVGAEINRMMLRACRRLPEHPGRRFILSTPANVAALGPYDAIFCMAVLTRRPHEIERKDVHNIRSIYPFERFAETIRFLANQLREGGLLVVEHALYRVEDAIGGLPLVPVRDVGDWRAKGARFRPDGTRIEPQPVVSRIFRRTRVEPVDFDREGGIGIISN